MRKQRERSLDGDEVEAVQPFGLRLIVPDHWEAVGHDGVDLSLDQLTDDRKSRMLPFVDDPADAIHCIANFGEDEVKVAVPVSVAVKHHSEAAG